MLKSKIRLSLFHFTFSFIPECELRLFTLTMVNLQRIWFTYKECQLVYQPSMVTVNLQRMMFPALSFERPLAKSLALANTLLNNIYILQ